MATTVTGKITAQMSAIFSKALDIGACAATPQLSVSMEFAAGEGENAIENVGTKVGSIAIGIGQTADIDLAGTLEDPGGDVIGFNKIKGFLVKNTSTEGDGFTVGGTFNTWLVKGNGAVVDEVKLMPGGCLLLANPTAAGYAVTPDSADVITLTSLDDANAQTYEVIVLGEIA